MKIDISKWINSLFLVLLLLNSSCSLFKRHRHQASYQEEACYATPKEDCDTETSNFQAEEFGYTLGRLLKTHGILLNDAIIASLNDASQDVMESGKINLYENAHEISNLLSPIYGSRVAHRFQTLFKQHIQLGAAYTQAIKFRNVALAKEIMKQAYANGHMIVEFLNIMNPFFASEPEKNMFDEHVTLESDLTVAYFKGDFTRAEELKERSLDQLQELASHITKAIQKQIDDQQVDLDDQPCDDQQYDDQQVDDPQLEDPFVEDQQFDDPQFDQQWDDQQ